MTLSKHLNDLQLPWRWVKDIKTQMGAALGKKQSSISLGTRVGERVTENEWLDVSAALLLGPISVKGMDSLASHRPCHRRQ
jgi:hypothetical protein